MVTRSKNLMILFSCVILSLQCGVKGRPLPPEEPSEIGTGRPHYPGLDALDKKSSEKKEKADRDKP